MTDSSSKKPFSDSELDGHGALQDASANVDELGAGSVGVNVDAPDDEKPTVSLEVQPSGVASAMAAGGLSVERKLGPELGSLGQPAPIEPDSLQGVVFACEGVEGATVLLNGPTGCKYYHSSISDSQTFRQMEFDPLNFPMTWYFGQPRVPCTYLDNSDYVYGSEKKLAEALEYFRDAPGVELLCIVNSPGAALIGDDLAGIASRHLDGLPFMAVETPGFSEGMCAGHEKAACAIVDHLLPGMATEKAASCHSGPEAKNPREATCSAGRSMAASRPAQGGSELLSGRHSAGEVASGAVEDRRVNVLGLSLYQRHYTGDVAEIRRLLEAMGLTIGCVLCAGGSIDDVRELPRAALNVVVNPEFGLQTAWHLQERFGTPYYVCDPLPIGFEATERMAREVCDLAGGDSAPVLAECREARKRAFSYISRLNSLTGLPTGVPFAVEGTFSQLRAYAEFFVRYLAMVPVALVPVFPQADCTCKELVDVLDELGFSDALGRDPIDGQPISGRSIDGGPRGKEGMAKVGIAPDPAFTQPELFFGSGATIGRMRLAGLRFSGVETMLPSLGYLDVVPKTHYGPRGALQLVESVLNGLVF